MKTVLISTGLPVRCGIAVYAAHLIDALIQHEEVVVTQLVEFGSSRLVRLRFKRLPCFDRHEDYQDELAKRINRICPDIVHIQHEYGIFQIDRRFIELLDKINCKKVITLHTTLAQHTAVEGLPMEVEEYNREIGSRVDKIIVHLYLQKRILTRTGIDARKIEVIRHGTQLFRIGNSAKCKEKLGFPSSKKMLLVFGFIGRDKQVQALIKVMKYIARRQPDAVIYVVGSLKSKNDERYGQSCIALRKRFGLEKNVVFRYGFFPEKLVPTLLCAADLIFCTGFSEGRSASGSLHTSLGACRPIIASRVPRFSEELTFAEEILVNPENTNDLVRLVLRLLNDKRFNNYISKKICDYARATSWEKVAVKTLKLYSEI